MKKFSVLIIAMILSFLLSSNILANTPNSDILYTITDDPSYLGANIVGDRTFFNQIELNYWKNHETFASVHLYSNYESLTASYLLNSGIFLGISNYYASGVRELIIAPGYRYNFNKSNYIAGKVIWHNSRNLEPAFIECDIYGKYFDEKTKLEGELNYNKYAISANGDINRKIADGIIIGSDFSYRNNYYNGYNYDNNFDLDLNGGLSLYNKTFTSNLRLLFSFVNADNPIRTPFAINADAMFHSDKLGIGLDYSSQSSLDFEDNIQWSQNCLLKAKLRFSDASLLFKYELISKNNGQWSLSYESML